MKIDYASMRSTMRMFRNWLMWTQVLIDIVDDRNYKAAIIQMIDNAEKYRWHDLRKNPEDLPKENGRYICSVARKLNPVSVMTYKPTDLQDDGRNKWIYHVGISDYVFDHFVRAWREIEPFEE